MPGGVEGEMIPTGSRGEPLAQEGEREVRRNRRRVDRKAVAQDGESVEPSQIETTDGPVGESHKPPTQGGESVEGSQQVETTDASTGPEEEPVSPMESPSSARTGPEEESVSPKESPSSDVEDVLCEEFRLNFRSIMTRAAANRRNNAAKDRRESVDHCTLTVETEFGDVDDGSFRSCKARKVAVLASKSVVSLSSFSDKKRIRVCSGFFIESDPCTNIKKILTSATLLRCLSTRNILIPDLKAGVGGPLVNYSGHVVGINFYGENHTPFLSTAIIIRCLEHWTRYGKIIRPWLGLIYTPVDMLPIRVLEKCIYVQRGFYISKVAKGSPADVAGLCTGDVLIECAGKVPSTAPELGALLLDFCKQQMESYTLENNMTVEVVVMKQRDGTKARNRVTARVLSECSYYRWYDPLPSYSDNKMLTMQIFNS